LRLRELAATAECAAVVKADAYGLGMDRVAPALARAGCTTFFVATLGEAESLRGLLPRANIYVLSGLMPGTAEISRANDLRPVLNSLSVAEVDRIADAAALWRTMTLSLVMSHLACSDEPRHPKNQTQRTLFETLRMRLPKALASLANSAGILLGRSYLYDVVRPGIALYGGKPAREGENPFTPVVHLKGRILQVRDVDAGETVGYGATRTIKQPARIATVSVGYADGFFRALSIGDDRQGFVAYAGRHTAPILGRVSMDLITIDVSNVPVEHSSRGGWAELIGPNTSAQDMAHHAGTIDYEVLTNLGRRAFRRYIGG
jgi:alanine racemase